MRHRLIYVVLLGKGTPRRFSFQRGGERLVEWCRYPFLAEVIDGRLVLGGRRSNLPITELVGFRVSQKTKEKNADSDKRVTIETTSFLDFIGIYRGINGSRVSLQL